MFSGDGPPSLSSFRTPDHGPNNQSWSNRSRSLDNPITGFQPAPSCTALVHSQGSSHNQFQDGTFYHGLGQSEPSFTDVRHGQGSSPNQNGTFRCGEGVQRPSVGDMVNAAVSDLKTPGTAYGYDQAPSREDMGRREASQTRASFTGNQNLDPQELVGMSFVKISASSIRQQMIRTKM